MFDFRLPTAQIVTISFFVPLLTLVKSDKWSCPEKASFNLTSANGSMNYSPSTVLGYTPSSFVYMDKDGMLISSNERWQRRLREVSCLEIHYYYRIQFMSSWANGISYDLLHHKLK